MKQIILFLGIAGYLTAGVDARDLGQWENADPAIRQWYQSLMQPDAPHASCCGEADAYWADEIHVRNGKTYVRITDDRPDEPLGRPHVDSGTEVEIPNHKLKWDRSESHRPRHPLPEPQRSRVLLRSARRRMRG